MKDLAPKGLKVGETFRDGDVLHKVTQVFDYGYNTEIVGELKEDIPLDELPFAPEADKPRRGGRKKRTEE